MTTGKVWVITGAARGIGSDLARAALDAGHRVVATAQDAGAVTAEIGERDRLLPLAMDVTDPAAIEGAVSAALDRFGSIDVLINNAGRFYSGFFETLSPEQVRAQMEVNFFGTLNVTRAVLPVMRAQHRGHIVTVGALLGVVGGERQTAFIPVLDNRTHLLPAALRTTTTTSGPRSASPPPWSPAGRTRSLGGFGILQGLAWRNGFVQP